MQCPSHNSLTITKVLVKEESCLTYFLGDEDSGVFSLRMGKNQKGWIDITMAPINLPTSLPQKRVSSWLRPERHPKVETATFVPKNQGLDGSQDAER